MTPDDLHAQALDLLVKGDTAGGITDLKGYLEVEPDDEGAWLELGAAYASIGHTIQAADALRCAVDLDGEDVEARLAYARALVRLKKLDDAAFQLLQASRLDPPDARVLKDLGLVFYDKRLYDKAAAWLTKAVAAAPNDARAHYALGLAREAGKDMGGAIAAYRAAVREDPQLIDARRTLADALAFMGEHEGAIAEYEALLTVDRSNEEAAHNRDVLTHALEEMKKHRLLGKARDVLASSALVREGGLRDKGEADGVARFAAPLVEMYAALDADRAISWLLLVFTDPERASRAEDDTYKVTVVTDDGRRAPADLATAVTLTFLRESLGCTMTQASTLYARLLGGEVTVEWGDATIGWGSAPKHGIKVSRAQR